MKVRCIRILDANGQPAERSPWLTLGRIYRVAGIHVEFDNECTYRILTDESSPSPTTMGFFRVECFEVVSARVPSNWSVRITPPSTLDIAPKTWQSPGWLERLYDGDTVACDEFKQEWDAICRDEN